MRHLHLLLHSPEQFEGEDPNTLLARMPALRALLRRGRPEATPRGLSEACCQALGIPRQQDWPLAPITAQAGGLAAGEAYWLRLDPVFLDVGVQGLFLRTLPPLSADAAKRLAEVVLPVLSQLGLEVHAGPQGSLLVRLDHVPDLVTTPLDQVDGRQITRFLPKGRDAAFWNRVQHEMQMALHEHPINTSRAAAGLPPVNSFWLWGGGRYLRPGQLPEAVWGSAPWARLLAQGLDMAWQNSPEDLTPILKYPGQAGVVFLDAAARPEDLDRDWCRPLLTALRLGQVRSVRMTVVGLEAGASQLRPWDAWRIWR